MTLALRFCAEPGDDELPAALSLRLDLRLPGVNGGQDAHALAQALQQAVGARGAVRALPDPRQEGAWQAWAPLEPLSAQTALPALRHLLEPLQRAAARLDRGAREDGAFVQQALQELMEALHDRAQLALWLRRRFPPRPGRPRPPRRPDLAPRHRTRRGAGRGPPPGARRALQRRHRRRDHRAPLPQRAPATRARRAPGPDPHLEDRRPLGGPPRRRRPGHRRAHRRARPRPRAGRTQRRRRPRRRPRRAPRRALPLAGEPRRAHRPGRLPGRAPGDGADPLDPRPAP
jgi:hypothetical protein